MQGHKPNKVFNPLVQGTGVLSFSKIPIIFDNTISSYSLQCNIKDYTMPGLRVEFQYDRTIAGHTTAVPTASVNDFSSVSLNVTMICDEDFENYTTLYRWLDVYKRLTYRSDFNTKDQLHWDAKQAYCPFVDIMLYNNNNRVKNIIRYKRVYLESIGDLFQDFSSDSPVVFSATFKFDEFFIYNDVDNINTALGEYT